LGAELLGRLSPPPDLLIAPSPLLLTPGSSTAQLSTVSLFVRIGILQAIGCDVKDISGFTFVTISSWFSGMASQDAIRALLYNKKQRRKLE
jgi:hypothetical protein